MKRARSEEKGVQVSENCLDEMGNLLGWDFLVSLGNIIPGFLFGFLGVLITEKTALNKTFCYFTPIITPHPHTYLSGSYKYTNINNDDGRHINNFFLR
jgi:hypothetical protein